jgi:hypothetical protein
MVSLGSSAFLGLGPVTFRPYLAIGLALANLDLYTIKIILFLLSILVNLQTS